MIERLSEEDFAAIAEQGITREDVPAILTPIYLGPTWSCQEDGSWHLPRRTLGWEIAGWCAEYLRAEEGGPWRFTAEQLRFLLWWYAVDETGRFIYRKGVLQRMKGWGKDPLLAVICLVELCGPSRFARWENGKPVGESHPQAWVQVAAVNQAQTRNTMTLIPSLMSDRFIATYDIKPGAELIRGKGGRIRLEAVTSSYRALEGGRSTFVVLNETHHWVRGNNGDKMYETIDGNATKKDSRYLAITNAYLPGEDSVAERMREAYDKIVEGVSVDIGFLYDSVEAHPRAPLRGPLVPLIIEAIRGDAVWLRPETIIQSIQDATMAPSRSRRMWFNQIVAEEDALHGPETWDPLGDDTLELVEGDEIVLGFDGGKTDDSTALVAIRTSDCAAFLLGLWEKPDGPRGEGWEVNRAEVDSAVHDAFGTYRVVAFFADVALWESYIHDWAVQYAEQLGVKASAKSAIGWDLRGSFKLSTLAHERLLNTIFDGKLKHNGDRRLRRHVLNARRRTNNFGVYFDKESRESPRKVDAYAALMLAHEALMQFREHGKPTRQKTGRSYFM